ncbi:hypothetical protein TIFTF001_050036 [Ficus carica]|uniref:Uncharacterized protein n=1 Tax=Ficus carica TaxID=3494 RepID=A0AA87YWV8_FICCA|nr:hypothetical protein TIFTF001_050036 [Ficus carica]
MEALVKRFDKGQDRIRSLEAENAALAAQIMDAFEKATFKARYDILKDYKEGLLNEALIDEEIEMYEEDYPDEARRSSAVLHRRQQRQNPQMSSPQSKSILPKIPRCKNRHFVVILFISEL